MEQSDLQRAIEAILFAAGERVEVSRLAATLEVDPADVVAAANTLADQLAFDRRGIRILRLDHGYQMVSSGEMADYITKTLETRKPPKLSASQLEALTIVAYYQPATKAMVDAAHSQNLAVHYWTINDPDEMRMLIDIGADGIMSDYPHRLAEVYAEYAEAE